MAAHMSQAEFGEVLGVGEKTVAAYENGRRLPSIRTLVFISEHFDMPLEYTFGFNEVEDKTRKEQLIDIINTAQLLSDQELSKALRILQIEAEK